MKQLLAAVIVSLVSMPALALECPVQIGDEFYFDKAGAAIKAAADCEGGAVIAEACALGASGDVQIAPVAERKCGLDFWQKLSKSDKAVYKGLQAKCEAKFKGMQGTMYISATAFCRLNVARLYSELYTPAE